MLLHYQKQQHEIESGFSISFKLRISAKEFRCNGARINLYSVSIKCSNEMERKRPKANQKKESKKEREKERLSLSRSTNAWIQINIIFELTECKLVERRTSMSTSCTSTHSQIRKGCVSYIWMGCIAKYGTQLFICVQSNLLERLSLTLGHQLFNNDKNPQRDRGEEKRRHSATLAAQVFHCIFKCFEVIGFISYIYITVEKSRAFSAGFTVKGYTYFDIFISY